VNVSSYSITERYHHAVVGAVRLQTGYTSGVSNHTNLINDLWAAETVPGGLHTVPWGHR